MQVNIIEAYNEYSPPFNVRLRAEVLLSYVPEKYLRGLESVVLSNASGFSRNRKRTKTWSRKKKVKISHTRGLYHPKWKNDGPWIEIIVDNTFSGIPPFLLRLALLKDIFLTEVLYHELGHHVHAEIEPKYREKEDVADAWRDKFTADYVRKCYWYLMPILWPISYLMRALEKVSPRFKEWRKG